MDTQNHAWSGGALYRRFRIGSWRGCRRQHHHDRHTGHAELCWSDHGVYPGPGIGNAAKEAGLP